MYFVPCQKCGFQVNIVLEEAPTVETVITCEECLALENF